MPRLTALHSSAAGHGHSALRVAGSRLRRAIAGTDLSVYPLALGTSAFGWTTSETTSATILDRYRARGGNFLDTADNYSSGRSELLIGRWLRSRGDRADTVIATKIGRGRDYPGLSATSIIGAVEASLARLGVDYIDLLYFHLDDPTVELAESLGAVDALVRAGQVRYLAVSGFSPSRLGQARRLSDAGLPLIVAIGAEYNLVARSTFESSDAVAAAALQLSVLPRFALAHGFLAGGFRSRSDLPQDSRGALVAPYLRRRELRVLATVDRIAATHGVPPATISLAWLLSRPGVVAPTVGVTHAEHVKDLMSAATVTLSPGELRELDHISA
ncbi:aldo/keto reductase [Cryobacterium melibiosiphilum]|uniref:Aldo/keto reductase n=1 Tax=Cryobacterium melibiosiphilum TaxID=995039 RepID=A0A3A5MP81_9MICO|nr:aldo/keto reductase [Cryobacterium melibiosiphilum]RJT87314.1 aldo/keto reductase [Cryobacterium melibiosiphilum]